MRKKTLRLLLLTLFALVISSLPAREKKTPDASRDSAKFVPGSHVSFDVGQRRLRSFVGLDLSVRLWGGHFVSVEAQVIEGGTQQAIVGDSPPIISAALPALALNANWKQYSPISAAFCPYAFVGIGYLITTYYRPVVTFSASLGIDFDLPSDSSLVSWLGSTLFLAAGYALKVYNPDTREFLPDTKVGLMFDFTMRGGVRIYLK